MSQQPKNFSILPKIINGGISGLIGITCIFPIDLCKTRLQSQQISEKGEKQYKSLYDCIRKTQRSEGFLGLYRGSAIIALLIVPQKAIYFSCNDLFRYHLTTNDGQLSISRQMLAGALAGLIHLSVITPMELLKIQAQNAGRIATEALAAGKEVQLPTAFSLSTKVLRNVGFLGLYKGIGPTALREISFSSVYFPLFATLNLYGPRKKDNCGEAVMWVSLLAGLGAGAFSSFIVTPIDVIKTRLQNLKPAVGEEKYKGIADCFVKTLKKEGPFGFFAGAYCRVVVIAPLFGIIQMVYYLGISEKLLGIK